MAYGLAGSLPAALSNLTYLTTLYVAVADVYLELRHNTSLGSAQEHG